MRTFTRRAAAVLLTWGLVGIGAPASAATDPPAAQPSSTTQPEADGCTRDPLGLVAGTAVHWVYVFKDPTPRYMRGVAANAYPTYTDLFTAHSSYDMNVFFKPSAAYHNYLGTANTATDVTQDKDEQDTMEIEWEQRAFGLPSWPTEGDDVELLGSWIWDCGHWGPQTFTDPRYFAPGTQPGEVVTGERTEMHPPRMVITHRALPSVTPNGDAVADVLINSNGTFARADEEKAIGNCVTQAACSQWIPVNDRDYSFDVAAPPRPRGAGSLHVDVVDQGSVNAPTPVITTSDAGAHVVVPFRGWGRTGDSMIFAKSFRVGWQRAAPLHHFKVTFERIDWKAELDGSVPFMCVPQTPCTGEAQQSTPPDEVNVYVDVAGQWRQLRAPQLLAVGPGQTIPLDEAADVYVPDSATWRVLARGRECDQPNMAECSANEIGLNDDAGIAETKYTASAGGVAGEHTVAAVSDHCANVGQPSCFLLTYRIDDLGAGAAAAAELPRGTLPATGQRGWPLAGLGLLVLALFLRRRVPST